MAFSPEQKLGISVACNIVLVAVCVGLTFLLGKFDRTVRVVSRSAENCAPPAAVQSRTPEAAARNLVPPLPEGTELLSEEENEQADKVQVSEWRKTQKLRQIERFVAVSAEERAKLLEKLEESDSLEAVQQVLGPEKAGRYEHDRDEAKRKLDEEEFEQEMFTLARKLALTSGQEVQVRDALHGVEQELAPMWEKIREKSELAAEEHTRPGGSENLKVFYAEIKDLMAQLKRQKSALMSEKLQGVLSDDQMNALAKYQAENVDPFFGE